jgi:homeobox protein ESX1
MCAQKKERPALERRPLGFCGEEWGVYQRPLAELPLEPVPLEPEPAVLPELPAPGALELVPLLSREPELAALPVEPEWLPDMPELPEPIPAVLPEGWVVELPVLAVELELPMPEEPPMPPEVELEPPEADEPEPVIPPELEEPELDEPEPERPEPEAPEPPTLEEPGAPEPEPPPLCARTGRGVKASAPAMHAPARMR